MPDKNTAGQTGFWRRNAAVVVVIVAALAIIGIIIAAALSTGGAGGSGGTAPSPAPAPVPAPAPAPDPEPTGPLPDFTPTGDTKVIVDCLGREVTVPAECVRIAAIDSFAGEAMVMAGAGPLMVAAPNGVSSDVILQWVYPDLVNVMSPKSSSTLNIEALTAVQPQVALIRSSTYYATDEIAKLDRIGLPYLVIEYQTIEDQIFALEMIGSILPAEQAAKMAKIVATYRDAVARVEAVAATIPEAERVRVYHAINSVTVTDGATSIGADWVSRVGAIDVSAGEATNTDRGDYTATLEQVFVWDPDFVVCNEANSMDYLLSDGKWVGLRAVMEGHVYNIPIGAGRWGQRGSLETWWAMIWLGKLVYPEYYAGFDLKAEVTAFYGDMLGVEVTDELWEDILAGRDLRKHATGENSQNP